MGSASAVTKPMHAKTENTIRNLNRSDENSASGDNNRGGPASSGRDDWLLQTVTKVPARIFTCFLGQVPPGSLAHFRRRGRGLTRRWILGGRKHDNSFWAAGYDGSRQWLAISLDGSKERRQLLLPIIRQRMHYLLFVYFFPLCLQKND